MSQENVEIVKRAFAEFERGNFWVPELFHGDVRIGWLDAVGTESETVGLQEMSNFMKNWLANFHSVSLVAEESSTPGTRSLWSPPGEGVARLRVWRPSGAMAECGPCAMGA